MSKICLVVAPVGSPITGQSRISEDVISRFREVTDKVIVLNSNTSPTKIHSIYRNLALLMKIVFYRGVNIDTVYFTCSRSKLGSIKDLVLLNLFSGKHIVCHLHGSDLNRLYNDNGLIKKMYKKSYSNVNVGLVCHPIFIDDLKELIGKNKQCLVYPNYICR